jgi:ribosome-binding factor A
VGELVRHALADMLARGEVHDPIIEGHLITVPEVQMTADLRLATIYVMPLGGRDTAAVLAALERNKRYLRGEIAHRVNLKFAPDLRFRIDERFDEAERIEKLLRTPEVRRDLDSRDPDSRDSDNRGLDNRGLDNRGLDNRGLDNRDSDDRGSDDADSPGTDSDNRKDDER